MKKKPLPSLMSLNENGNESAKKKKISWKEIKEKNLCIKCLQLGYKKKDYSECLTPKDGCFLLLEEGTSCTRALCSLQIATKQQSQFWCFKFILGDLIRPMGLILYPAIFNKKE